MEPSKGRGRGMFLETLLQSGPSKGWSSTVRLCVSLNPAETPRGFPKCNSKLLQTSRRSQCPVCDSSWARGRTGTASMLPDTACGVTGRRFQPDARGTEHHNLQVHFNPLLCLQKGADQWVHVLQRRGTEVQSQAGDLPGGPESCSSVLQA